MQRSARSLNVWSLSAFGLVAPLAAQTIPVTPGMGMPAIQALIDANPGATIVFAPGDYLGNLVISSDIGLQGAGSAATRIDGLGQATTVLDFRPGITRATVVSDLTIRNGGSTSPVATGGGVLVVDAGPVLRRCVVEDNVASQGGGVYVIGDPPFGRSLLLDECVVQRNAANQGGGIAIWAAPNGAPGTRVEMRNCLVADNAATAEGGGIFVKNVAMPTIDRCVIERNVAWFDGGGLYWREGSRPTVSECLIRDNQAARGGGVCYWLTGSAVIEHCCILANRAIGTALTEGGGGLFGRNQIPGEPAPKVIVRNVLFADNMAAGDGGAMLLHDPDPAIRFVTVADNLAGGTTGGILHGNTATSAVLSVRNSIVWGNQDAGPLGSLASNLSTGALLPDVRWSDVQASSPAPWFALWPGNLDADPEFVTGYACLRTPDARFFLGQREALGEPLSPCVDATNVGIFNPTIFGRCTHTGGRSDGGDAADMGFHYPTTDCP